MLIVKTVGQSVVSSGDPMRQIKESKHNSIAPTVAFAKSNPNLLIGQWISAIDKVIGKPIKGEVISGQANQNLGETLEQTELRNRQLEFRTHQLGFRTRLGDKCWELLRPSIEQNLSGSTIEEWKQYWDFKIHPLGSQASNFDNSKLRTIADIYGGWRSAFFLNEISTDEDFAQLASKIQSHLLTQEVRKHGGTTRPFHPNKNEITEPRGLVENRANSIAVNTLSKHIERGLSGDQLKALASETVEEAWSNQDEMEFSKIGDLAKDIYLLADQKEQGQRRLLPTESAAKIFAHYGKSFPGLKRLEIATERRGLLALYDAARTYYRTFLKNTKKGSKNDGEVEYQKLTRVLPRNNRALFALLKARDVNAITNDLIRLGRVLHYESTEGDGDGFGLGVASPIWQTNLKDIARSDYWSSSAQAGIKRTEAFVRVWRNSLTLAARTAKTIVDPKSEYLDQLGNKADVLAADVRDYYSNNSDCQTQFTSHLPLLFGKNETLFRNLPVAEHLTTSLRILARLRNQAIHFKGCRTFVAKLIGSLKNNDIGTPEVLATLSALHIADQREKMARLTAIVTGAHIQTFCNQGQINHFMTLLKISKECTLTLPKMNRLLKRIKDTGLKIVMPDNAQVSFPEDASHVELKHPWRLAHFIGYKLIYEGPFREWLEDQKSDLLVQLAKAAKQRTTLAARNMNRKDPNVALLVAKAEALPLPELGDDMEKYFAALQVNESREMRLQRGYESNPEAAREAMSWVDDFKCDVVARAFAKYMFQQRINLSWLLNLSSTTPSHAPVTYTQQPQAVETPPQWASCLYYALHFVPVDDASRLLHQFRKWDGLEKREEDAIADASIEQIMQLFSLYILMHDAKHDGAGMETAGLDKFKDLFKCIDDFDRVFKTEGSTDERLTATRRGLREIMRFGHLEILTAATTKTKITSDQVKDLLEFEQVPIGGNAVDAPIAKAQLERKKLHKLIVKPISHQLSEPEKARLQAEKHAAINAYPALLETISEHRHLANQVRLNYHIRLHRILVRVVSRLVDFAGLWERDGYFIALALMRLHNKTPNDVFTQAESRFRTEGKLPDDITNVQEDFRRILLRFHTQDLRHIRNNIDHFNFMNENDVDLTQQIESIRKLLSYDRKLKNAVTKSIIEMFDEEGMLLAWKMNNHKLEAPKLVSKKIKHLANTPNPIMETQHHPDYLNMVLQLLSANSPSDNAKTLN